MLSNSIDVQRIEEDSEDELDWEEIEVPGQQHLEITIQAASHTKTDSANKKKGISHAERLIRIDCHKIHTISLLGNAWVRNKWINDPLLHARLLSLTPLSLQNTFSMIHKSRIPDQNQRGRMFETAITRLAEWWSGTFFEVAYSGHIRNRTFDDVQTKLSIRNLLSQEADAVSDVESLEDILGSEGEQIRSPKSLMKHALMQTGSRDTSAQLFTALCRALGIPTRLVVSLQSVPWQAAVGKPRPDYRRKINDTEGGKGKQKEAGENVEADEMGGDYLQGIGATRSSSPSVFGVDVKSEVKTNVFGGEGQRLDGATATPKSEKAKGKQKAVPVVKLRKSKAQGKVLGSRIDSLSPSSSRLGSPSPTTAPPVFWTEVFSRPDARWLPVDPVRCIINKRKVFDPSPSLSAAPAVQSGSIIYPHPYASSAPKKKNNARSMNQENRMVYVLAFEEDGYARDVTRRYAKEFGAKVAKVQGGSSAFSAGGVRRQAWWQGVVGTVSRPYRLHRDDLEDEELEAAQMMEGMPTTVSGFKDHPLYVLNRHLKQTQTIYPAPPVTPELGKFRGEPVYPRSSVISLKTAEHWMRSEGRTVKEGCQPLKFVKVRAGTVGRMRELEILKDELKEAGEQQAGTNGNTAGSEVMQGLYARSQTELFKPDPIVDGKVPKNTFGNIDLYVPSMLPDGGVHVPFKGVAKIARKLGFDYAEAVTGFEFKKRRAFPVIEGIVIAEESEAVLLEAYWEAERDADQKARNKRQEQVIKHWTRLIQGLRIRQRLQHQYAVAPGQERDIQQIDHETPEGGLGALDITIPSGEGGGFLIGADDVVQAFHLPKYQHVNLPLSPHSTVPVVTDDLSISSQDISRNVPDTAAYDLQTMDVDSDMEEVPTLPDLTIAPKSMQELAENAAKQRIEDSDNDHHDNEFIDTDTHRPLQSTQSTNSKSTPKTQDARPSKIKSRKSPTSHSRSSARLATARKRKKDDEDDETSNDESLSVPKRQTRDKSHISPPVPTRTLRPRISKSRTQRDEEREQEEAFKRAVAR